MTDIRNVKGHTKTSEKRQGVTAACYPRKTPLVGFVVETKRKRSKIIQECFYPL
jgi:hypothetical protein